MGRGVRCSNIESNIRSASSARPAGGDVTQYCEDLQESSPTTWIANGRASNRIIRLRSLRASAEERAESNIGRADGREEGRDELVAIREPFAKVSKALRDLECEIDLCCNGGRYFLTVEAASSLDKHSTVGKPDSKKDDDGLRETPGVDGSEPGTSFTLRANNSASSWSSNQSKSSLGG